MVSPFTALAARPAQRLADGDDTVCLMIKSGGHMALQQGRREAEDVRQHAHGDGDTGANSNTNLHTDCYGDRDTGANADADQHTDGHGD